MTKNLVEAQTNKRIYLCRGGMQKFNCNSDKYKLNKLHFEKLAILLIGF